MAQAVCSFLLALLKPLTSGNNFSRYVLTLCVFARWSDGVVPVPVQGNSAPALGSYLLWCERNAASRRIQHLLVRLLLSHQIGIFVVKFLISFLRSNGDLDPWSGGGVLTAPNDLQTVFLIEGLLAYPQRTLLNVIATGGAHHLDLRTPNPLDPPSTLSSF